MNRAEEYKALLQALKQTPEALEQTVEKALRRKKAAQRKRRMLGIPAGSLAACFASFILLVNLLPPFAAACEGIPVLGALAKAVDWSPSLSAAVENDYVQPINVTRSANGISATVEYVIVDQKQLNIFYTLAGEAYDYLDTDVEISGANGATLEGFGSFYGTYGENDGSLRQATADFQDREMPPALELTLKIYDSTALWAPNTTDPGTPEQSYQDEMLEPVEREARTYLAELTFLLTFDPQFTDRGEKLAVNQTFLLDGQTLTLTEAEIYPTHMRLNFTASEDNTAWLTALTFEVENERGKRFAPISNGISAYGDTDSPMMVSYTLESPYFATSRHLTLRITGERWLDKDRQRIKVDLKNGTAEDLPDLVSFLGAEQRQGGWILTFAAREYEEHRYYQTFGSTYYDTAGTEYEIGQFSSDTGGEPDEEGFPTFTITVPLAGYDQDTVWLSSNFTRVTQEQTPVELPIR